MRPHDEGEHTDVAVESWWWWTRDETADIGLFVGLEVRGRRFDYWCGLVRSGAPYLYAAELDGLGRRDGLELKPAEMWADHVCDIPFTQWSVANELYAVLLDDPHDACGRAYGERVPVAADIEWAAAGDPEAFGERGYRQRGEADVVVELKAGNLRFSGPAERLHVWGVPFVPADLALPVGVPHAPYRRTDGRCVNQVLTSQGWLGRPFDTP